MSGELPRDVRRDGSPYRVAVVCLGNICRSPMADVVLTDRLEVAGLSADVEVVSAGTGGWHVGGGMDERAARLLERHGYDPTRHRAQQFSADWFERCDLVLAMDAQNHRDLAGLGPAERLRMFRDFDPEVVDGPSGEPSGGEPGDRDVPDPYFGDGDGFEQVLAMVERTADALVAALRDQVRGERPGAGG